jgi:hypothetical protein
LDFKTAIALVQFLKGLVMEITIGFSYHKGFAIGSWAIRMFLNKPFSHVYFKYKEKDLNTPTIYHAVGKGLTYISEDNFHKENETVSEFKINISEELFKELKNDCHEHASMDYGFFQNFGIVAVRALARIGIEIKKNPINDGINCSEWAFYILEEIYGKWTECDPNLVGPDQVFDFLKANEKVGQQPKQTEQ